VVASIGFQEGLGRLLGTSLYEVTWSARRDVYAATLELWQRFPITGSGMATFREAFPLVQPPHVTGTWWHAHSDWLELLATGGLVAAAILALGLILLARRLDRVLRHGSRSEDRAAALAAFGALIMAALHSLVDFGITMPGTAVTLAVVVGAGAGVVLRN
jgi:O-antigen ligase